MLRSFCTAELATRRFAALRSDNCGESGGRRRAGYGGCALTDALWLGVAASLAAQLQKIHSPSASIKRPDYRGRYPPRIPGWERETLRPPRLPGRCACSVRCKKAASGCWVQTGPGRRRLGRPLWAVSMRVAGGRQVWSWGRGRNTFLERSRHNQHAASRLTHRSCPSAAPQSGA